MSTSPATPTRLEKRELVLAHSPDSDDAFMFYALATRKLRPRSIKFKHVLEDIEKLNQKAIEGVFDVTAISFGAYPFVAGHYCLLSTGASIADGYGPLLVASRLFPVEELKNKRVAVPGKLTTAFLLLKLLEPEVDTVVVPFDRILEAVREGAADAGLLIHEGQLTFDRLGLHRIVDLGRWWQQQQHLPLPLGAVAVRRDLPRELQLEVARLLHRSIEYAMEHREEAMSYALQFARDLDPALADKFVGMYVNEYSLDCGPIGREAVARLLELGYERGALPQRVEPEFL